MKKLMLVLVSIALVGLCLPALAQDTAAPAAEPAAAPAAAPAPAMDMTALGGASRPIKQEKLVKKELAAFFKAQEAAMHKGDLEACWAGVDYPVLMISDDAKGQGSGVMMTRDEYIASMKPFMETPPPKGFKMSAKYDVTVITDSLAVVVTKITMKMGKKKASFKNASMVIKKDGKWVYKMMAEGGWGDAMGAPPADAPAPAAP
ncbi:MAG TPA: hypothetical protein PK668_01895 [Myxococcota bacterium]|nr:hypothetical protein [Myxococcota bacterium]HRY94680.1 hypothetical protein [Myxococcota bacterium]HSA22093.1 hypothetical protein [Myxococcota bacterium]